MRAVLAALAAILLLTPLASAADAPDWLTRAAAQPARAGESSLDALVLWDDATATVQPNGRIVIRRQYAVRVFSEEAAKNSVVREIYTTDGGEVRTMRGWRIRDGRSTEIDRRAIVDVALVDNDVYNEVRARVLHAPELTPGSVFGAETEVALSVPYPQIDWTLQGEWPVAVARRSLTLPAGWNARAITFNYPTAETTRSGLAFAWEFRDIQALPDELVTPPMTSRALRLAVSYGPGNVTALDDWAAVSRWLYELSDPQAAPSPSLIAKARELTAGATTELEKIRAIGRYAQRVQYISVQTGLGRGGGYKPHAASDVLARDYGDCKDKANLMRALLAVVGVQANLVAIFSGDPDYVRPEWASPQQFNHCIIAILVGADITSTAIADVPALGRVLFFDPTDADTPVGALPRHEQHSLALIMSKGGTAAVRVPATEASAHLVSRRVSAMLSPVGAVTATIEQVRHGASASEPRYRRRALAEREFKRSLEVEGERQIPGATVTIGPFRDDDEGNRVESTLTLQASAFGQRLTDSLVLLRAPAMLALDLPVLPPGARQSPIRLRPIERQDHVTLQLPLGLSVDELPEPISLETPYGRLSMTWTQSGRALTRELSLAVSGTTVPADQYAAVRAFVTAVRDAERASAVVRVR